MCIAIMKPKGETLDIADLEECWSNNPHGAGLMFADKGKLIVRKGWMKWRNFRRAWERQDLTDYDVVLHFRISTGGRVNQANCHPHMIDPGIGVVHNGIFSSKLVPILDTNYSDTCHFVRMLKELGKPDFLRDSKIMKWVGEVAIGSKLIFLESDGNWRIVNEKQGEWHKGSWFSNCGYKYPAYYGTYEPWERNSVTGAWESPKTSDSRCETCNARLYLESEKDWETCLECVTSMHEQIQNERRSYDSTLEERQIAEDIAQDDQREKRIHEASMDLEYDEYRMKLRDDAVAVSHAEYVLRQGPEHLI